MNEDKQYLSKEKFEELKAELEQLKSKKRREIAEKLEFAKSLGDLSENAEYQEARDDQAALEDRIMNLEAILKQAEIVTKKRGGKGVVSVGSIVTVQRVGEKDKKTYTIVGSEEVDTEAGKISNVSPMGSALMGLLVGDTATCLAPNGEYKCKVVEIA